MPPNVDRETLELKALAYAGSTVLRSTGELPDPKDRLEVYRLLNDSSIQSVRPENGAAFEKALASLKDVLSREPRIPRTYALYGELLLQASRGSEAAEVFQTRGARRELRGSLPGLRKQVALPESRRPSWASPTRPSVRRVDINAKLEERSCSGPRR
jgi:hypothetical protein